MDGYSRYFSFGADDIPPRTGYFIGLRLVERWLRMEGEGSTGADPGNPRPAATKNRRSTAEKALAAAIRLPAANFV